MALCLSEETRTSSPTPGRILLVDDESAVLETLSEVLRGAGHEVQTCSSIQDAQFQLTSTTFDVVVTDLAMPGTSGLNLIEWASHHKIDSSWVILTGSGRYEDAIEAVRRGAHDYLCKPVQDLPNLYRSVGRAIDRCRDARANKRTLELVNLLNRELEARMGVLEGAIQASAVQAKSLAEDLQQARLIEQSMLPRGLFQSERVSTFAWYQPCGEIGGDLYDVFPIGNHHVGFYVADASGHGISAALLAALLKPSIQPTAPHSPLQPRSPSEVLTFLSNQLHGYAFEASMFVSIAYGVVDTRDMTLSYASAGHPAAWVVDPSGRCTGLKATGPAIGLQDRPCYEETTLNLGRGDRVLMCTDGVLDVRRGSSLRFGEERLAAAMQATSTLASNEVIPSIRRQLSEYTAEDDMTLLLIALQN